jgi:hypothetical protein
LALLAIALSPKTYPLLIGIRIASLAVTQPIGPNGLIWAENLIRTFFSVRIGAQTH